MRLRATRLSATGGHTRKRGIDIAALFAAYPGRVGCYYGTKSGPSYTDILARNREALGPELVANGDFAAGLDGWVKIGVGGGYSTGDGAATVSGGTSAGLRKSWVLTVGKVYYAELTARRLAGAASAFLTGTSTSSTGGAMSYVFVATKGHFEVGIVGDDSTSAWAFGDISVREIVDWSKLVLFDDANGTVPVFSVFQSSRGRGLLLDASKGLVRGAESWSQSAGVYGLSSSLGGGAYRIYTTDGSDSGVQTAAAAVIGKWYEFVFTVDSVAVAGGGLKIGPAGVAIPATTGQKRYLWLADSTNLVVHRMSGATDVQISNVSVRELPGNHMVQPTAAARGEFSARYNRITNSEFMLGAVGTTPTDWVERGNVTGRVVDDPLSPSGKAMRVTVSVGGGIATSSDVRVPSSDLVSGASTRIRVLAKRVSGASNAAWAAALSTGVFALTDQYAWYEADFAATSTSNGLFLGSSQVMTFDVAAVDLRLAADAIPSIPAYQRVTSATDYDDVGFPVYWRAQTDDWAKTRINPSGATKALVMWAGQKMSDAAIAVVLESSINTNNLAGTLALFAPLNTAAGADIGYRSRGSEPPQQKSFSPVLAPARVGVRGISDIAGDYINGAINGVLGSVPVTGDQGTGGYTEQDVYFASRAGTSLFANIREFAPPLILFQPPADTSLSASQITALDKAYAKAAGVTL